MIFGKRSRLASTSIPLRIRKMTVLAIGGCHVQQKGEGVQQAAR
jgi:hypothetical protein